MKRILTKYRKHIGAAVAFEFGTNFINDFIVKRWTQLTGLPETLTIIFVIIFIECCKRVKQWFSKDYNWTFLKIVLVTCLSISSNSDKVKAMLSVIIMILGVTYLFQKYPHKFKTEQLSEII